MCTLELFCFDVIHLVLSFRTIIKLFKNQINIKWRTQEIYAFSSWFFFHATKNKLLVAKQWEQYRKSRVNCNNNIVIAHSSRYWSSYHTIAAQASREYNNFNTYFNEHGNCCLMCIIRVFIVPCKRIKSIYFAIVYLKWISIP